MLHMPYNIYENGKTSKKITSWHRSKIPGHQHLPASLTPLAFQTLSTFTAPVHLTTFLVEFECYCKERDDHGS